MGKQTEGIMLKTGCQCRVERPLHTSVERVQEVGDARGWLGKEDSRAGVCSPCQTQLRAKPSLGSRSLQIEAGIWNPRFCL